MENKSVEERAHNLKTWPEYFQAIKTGQKTFEARINDRGFIVGDILILEEYDIRTGYTGDKLRRRIGYILEGMGLPDGMVVMSLEPQAARQDQGVVGTQGREALANAMEECERLAGLVEYWQKRYYDEHPRYMKSLDFNQPTPILGDETALSPVSEGEAEPQPHEPYEKFMERTGQAYEYPDKPPTPFGEAEPGMRELSCMYCGESFIGPEPKRCCSGDECSCMGMPIDPVVCSRGCHDMVMQGKGVIFDNRSAPPVGIQPLPLPPQTPQP